MSQPHENSRQIWLAKALEAIANKLAPTDDRALWEASLSLLFEEFLRGAQEQRKTQPVFQIGLCSRWVRPHQTRWTAGGGFAYPEGYQNSLPELDWYILFNHEDGRWIPLAKPPGKRSVIFRVAIPARTAKHAQAAIHTKWSTSERPVFYGFRKKDGVWDCVATSDARTQGPVGIGDPREVGLVR